MSRTSLSQSFYFPMRDLESDRVCLKPFLPSIHSDLFIQECQDHPELFDYLPWGPFASAQEFNAWYTTRIESDPGNFLFVVLDKSRKEELPGAIAGIIGLLNTVPSHESTEVGFIVILPRFRRTHVTTNAIGLLLQYTLDPSPVGLGLRRVQWQAHASNSASIRAAERMGFVFEGIQRWQRILPSGKEGNGRDRMIPSENTSPSPGRDTAVLAICWDDWVKKRTPIMEMMNRQG